MMKFPSTLKFLFACGFAVSLANLPPALAAGFKPHRAVYDLTLKNSESASGISTLSGKMVFEVQGSVCEGYTVEFRLITEIGASNGTTRLTDVRTSSFEAPEGADFQFLTQTFLDHKLSQESRGVATRDAETLMVTLKKPAERLVTFDRKVMFPSQHFFEIIRMAQAGEKFLSVDIYDGSEDGDTYFETAAVIGKPRDIVIPEGEPKGQVTKHWPVIISYYDPRKGKIDATPIYTLRFLTNVPGVSRDLTMDYNSFVIRGELADLTFFPDQSCD